MKRIFQRALKVFNVELRSLDSPTRSFERGLEILSRHISPGTVIDVGAADGTQELYRQFPDNRYLLVEANTQFRPDLERVKSQIDATVEWVLCGREPGERQFNLYGHPGKSSMLQPLRYAAPLEQRILPVERLDALAAKHKLPGPYLIKLDVEGAEVEVLEGALGLLPETQAIVAESSVAPTHQGAPEFAELVGWLASRGFSVFDLVAGFNHPRTGLLYQVDIIFVRTDAPFRIPP